MKEQGITSLLKVLNGGTVEPWRYHSSITPQSIANQLVDKRAALKTKPKISDDQIKEFVISLTLNGYINESTKRFTVRGVTRSTTVYSLTQ
jgi:hypothetical protein